MIDRGTIDQETAEVLDERRDYSAAKRERNASAGLCINENKRGTHGLATDGVRCKRCALVHKYGARIAHSMPEWREAKPVFADPTRSS